MGVTGGRVLVLGATGFLGQAVCRLLKSQGIDPIVSSLSLGTDLRDAQATQRFFETNKPAYVLNCAAFVGGIQFCLERPTEIFDNNLKMTLSVLNACRVSGVKRLVNPIANCAYPGDAEVYRESEFWDGPLHDSVFVYGMARKMSYVGAVAYRQQHGLDTVNLIFPNMYGPGDHFEPVRSHALGALIHKMCVAKDTGAAEVVVWGTGAPVREWLFVDEGAEAIVRAMEIPKQEQPLNIGVGDGVSIRDLAETIRSVVGFKGQLVFDKSKPDGAPRKVMDGSLGAKVFGWKPSVPLVRGIELSVAAYRARTAHA